jgi:hypothetical protein
MSSLIDYYRDGWSPEQYAYCMKQAYREKVNRGIPDPHVDYHVALEWHNRHKKTVVSLLPASKVRAAASESG